jgi:hypothetical protein
MRMQPAAIANRRQPMSAGGPAPGGCFAGPTAGRRWPGHRRGLNGCWAFLKSLAARIAKPCAVRHLLFAVAAIFHGRCPSTEATFYGRTNRHGMGARTPRDWFSRKNCGDVKIQLPGKLRPAHRPGRSLAGPILSAAFPNKFNNLVFGDRG